MLGLESRWVNLGQLSIYCLLAPHLLFSICSVIVDRVALEFCLPFTESMLSFLSRGRWRGRRKERTFLLPGQLPGAWVVWVWGQLMESCPKHWVALVTLQPQQEKTFSQPRGLETRTLMILACIKAPKAFGQCLLPYSNHLQFRGFSYWLLTDCTPRLLSGGLACALEGCFLFAQGLFCTGQTNKLLCCQWTEFFKVWTPALGWGTFPSWSFLGYSPWAPAYHI